MLCPRADGFLSLKDELGRKDTIGSHTTSPALFSVPCSLLFPPGFVRAQLSGLAVVRAWSHGERQHSISARADTGRTAGRNYAHHQTKQP